MTLPHDAPQAGRLRTLRFGIQTVLAPNPSPMTYWGTNTYLLGQTSVAIVDPGPDDPDHRKALMAAVGGRRVSHILVTHSHVDHSPLARSLSADTGAKVYAFGDSATGRSPAMTELAQFGEIGGGEGVDQSFTPDVQLADGDIIEGEGWSLTALHTPGHFGNHMCFVGKGYAFTGDHVMEWASSLVSPPDGDLTDFLASCRKLASTGAKVGYSGHGAPIEDLPARLKALIEHRLDRETQIRTVLTRGPMTPAEITKCLYTDVNPALLPMAERNVLAHLVDLTGRGLVSPEGRLTAGAKFISRSG